MQFLYIDLKDIKCLNYQKTWYPRMIFSMEYV